VKSLQRLQWTGLADPLLFTVLEMAFRLSKNPDEQMQLFHLLDAVMDPISTQQLRAVGPSWAAALPLVGVLVSVSKVLRTGDWGMPSVGLACKVMQRVLSQVCGIWKAWLEGDGDVRSSGCGAGPGLVSGPGGKGEQQQQQRDELGEMLDSLTWAEHCLVLSLTDVLHDVTWLAVQVARQMQSWEVVKQKTAAKGAAIDGGLTAVYVRLCNDAVMGLMCAVSTLAQAADCGATVTFTSFERLMAAEYGAVTIVDTLLTQFGSARVLAWARKLRPWPGVEVSSESEVASSYDRLSAKLASNFDNLAPGSKGLAAWLGSLPPFPQIMAKQVWGMWDEQGSSKLVGEWGSRRFEVEPTDHREIGDMSLDGLRGVGYSAAGVLSTCSARGCCSNPRCVNLGGVSEMGLVVGREGARGVCSACREVCYCSRKCQEEAWLLHKRYCSCIAKINRQHA
jgi:hypothetical protein